MKNKLIFLISPFLAAPFAIDGLFNKRKNAIFVFSLIISYLSYLYVPSLTNDKAYYFELHEQFSKFSLIDFITYVSLNKTDFIFYFIIYFVSSIGLTFQSTSFIITFLTIFIILNFTFLIMKHRIDDKSIWVLFLITLILSISQPHLFSGMRNYLGVAFLMAAFYYAVISNSKLKTVAFCALAIFTHFGTIPIALMTLVLAWFDSQKVIKLFFLISLGFIFIPRDFLYENISGFVSNEIYSSKVSSYLGEETFLEKSLAEGNFNNYLRIVLENLWYWIGLIFVFFNFKSNTSKLFITLLAYLAVSNIFYSAPDIFARNSLFVEIILVLCIFETVAIKNRIFVFLFSCYIAVNSLFDVITLRENYHQSFVKSEVIFLPIAFISDNIDQKDFIKK